MDPIRNHAYEWIISQLPKTPKNILDVGSRDSGFSSFLASLGHKVTSVERFNFVETQQKWNQRFNVKTRYIQDDLLNIKEGADIITAVYALQHNVDKDVECYRHCARLANTIFIVNEFNFEEPKFQYGRDDGDLRIYSMQDIQSRILTPISDIRRIRDIQYYSCKFVFEKQSVSLSPIKDANTLGIKIEL